MPNTAKKFLLYYSTAASLFFTLSGFFSVKEIKNASIQLIFLPVTMFLFLTTSAELKQRLHAKTNEKPVIPAKKNKKGLIILAVLLYFVFLAFGLKNIINQSTDNHVPLNTYVPQEESTPLVFKDEEKRERERVLVVVEGNNVPLTKEASRDSETIKEISENTEFEVIEKLDNWYKLYLDDETDAYVENLYVKNILK